jgi:hypothetical protein
VFCDELPQWITSSDIAAYHPWSKTIYIRKKLGFFKTIKVFFHEIIHYLIHITHLPKKLHNILDKK